MRKVQVAVWMMVVSFGFVLLTVSLPAYAGPDLSAATADDSDFGFEDDFGFEEEFSADDSKLVIADPLYPLNKAVFAFNDAMYVWVMRPVAKGWAFVVPDVARNGLKNFFRNLGAPVRMVNALFQRNTDRFENEFGRFFVNTIAGLGGFMDPAMKHFNRMPQTEDMGQTLAVYGVGNGCYLVLPFLGPSTLRDSVGMVGDFFLDPGYYLIDDVTVSAVKSGVDVVNQLSFRYPDMDMVRKASIDPYAAFRDGYLQLRQAAIDD